MPTVQVYAPLANRKIAHSCMDRWKWELSCWLIDPEMYSLSIENWRFDTTIGGFMRSKITNQRRIPLSSHLFTLMVVIAYISNDRWSKQRAITYIQIVHPKSKRGISKRKNKREECTERVKGRAIFVKRDQRPCMVRRNWRKSYDPG